MTITEHNYQLPDYTVIPQFFHHPLAAGKGGGMVKGETSFSG
ncbi:MAG: hypothetical protein Q6K81_01880 [Gloeomargarita sp. DG02_5_bins_242]